ncbi:MAG: DUF1003 domain-containing protein [Deltaproteobacteria bacterium]|nr:DUF1003 domain-containing protein [Deltaproteobacteria bacterium]
MSSDQSAAGHFRFHQPHINLHAPFGTGGFGRAAEAFARAFGSPIFVFGQTAIVLLWIGANAAHLAGFDPYPFILLNLAFSLQAAYAAPLILLAQTRQARRDLANARADARHREELAQANLELLRRNTDLTEHVAELARRIDRLTAEIHGKVVLR